MDWIHLIQDRVQWRSLLNTVINLRVSKKDGNLLARWDTTRFSRRNLLHGVMLWHCVNYSCSV